MWIAHEQWAKSIVLPELSTENPYLYWIKIHTSTCPLLFCNIYIPPREPRLAKQIYHELELNVQELGAQHPLCILGDFNADPDRRAANNEKLLQSFCAQHRFFRVLPADGKVSRPSSGYNIDHILVNAAMHDLLYKPLRIASALAIPANSTRIAPDHLPLIAALGTGHAKRLCKRLDSWNLAPLRQGQLSHYHHHLQHLLLQWNRWRCDLLAILPPPQCRDSHEHIIKAIISILWAGLVLCLHRAAENALGRKVKRIPLAAAPPSAKAAPLHSAHALWKWARARLGAQKGVRARCLTLEAFFQHTKRVFNPPPQKVHRRRQIMRKKVARTVSALNTNMAPLQGQQHTERLQQWTSLAWYLMQKQNDHVTPGPDLLPPALIKFAPASLAAGHLPLLRNSN
jgi:hypothetical protein